MSTATLDELVVRNPSDGREVARVARTPVAEVATAVGRAREAQRDWAARGWGERRRALRRWWSVLSRDADAWALALRDEIGKPKEEALGGDVVSTLDALRWTVRHGGKALRGYRAGPGHQRLLQIPAGRVVRRPIGVVGMIGTWNYPLFLNAAPIAQALAAGNGVVWKPSELAPGLGRRLQEGLDEARFPPGLVAAVYGGPEVGRALVDSDVDKGFFTGGVVNGRQVLGAWGARGVPAVAELSGFDPAIVLPGAPVDATVRAIAWGAFVNAGQTCVGVRRVYVVGDPSPWAEALAAFARGLRVGDPSTGVVDLGPLVSGAARDRVHETVRKALEAGAEVLSGGAVPDGPGAFYPPTVLLATTPGPEAVLTGVFGPVLVVRGVGSADEAVAAANAGDYGLAASVWSADLAAARAVAGRLDAGMVTVNDVVAPVMHAAAPFGGTKASGFGRTHGAEGLLEFTQSRVVYERRAGGFRPNQFPYGRLPVEAVLHVYRRLFHAPRS